jgi:hypothetical protein
LFAAKVMREAAGRPGLYMALPTTATADQIYLRVRRYLETQAETASPLMLLHGMVWLSTQYAPDPEPALVATGDGREGDRVVVGERDPAGDGARPGVPRGQHMHTLLPGGLGWMERWLPGLTKEMQHGGAALADSYHVTTGRPDKHGSQL